MQLSLFNDLYVVEQEGFTVTKTFESSNNIKFQRLESTYSIVLDGRIILYVQDNSNGTFNTFGFMHERFGVSLNEVVEIVKNKHNWCLSIKALEKHHEPNNLRRKE